MEKHPHAWLTALRPALSFSTPACLFPALWYNARRTDSGKTKKEEPDGVKTSMTLLTKEEKQEIIGKFKRSAGDNGSSEVQIAILTKKINLLTEHLKANKYDHSSRRGLMMMVSRRRRLLDYLKDREPQRYVDVIQALGIRK